MTNAALSAPLTAFSFVWASVTAIKTAAKLVARGEWRVSQPTVVLLLALAPSLLAPLSSAAWRGERARLVALAAGVGVHALVEGARSNHVLCELCLCASVMLSALHAIGHSGATASQERSAAMTSALRTGARAQLTAMYAIAVLHKMNDDFWDPTTSCSSQVAATVFAQWGPGGALGLPGIARAPSGLVRVVVRSSPAAALILETALAVLIGISTHRRGAERCAVIGAQAFHLMLAMPLPPGSFYPFSLICHVIFIALRPRAFAAVLADRRGGAVLAIALGGVWPSLRRAIANDVIVAEYPPYALWPLGVALCAALAGLNGLAAFEHEPLPRDRDGGRGDRRANTAAPSLRAVAVAAGALVAIPGLLPYAAVRTYPALAMFSNLRLEDTTGGNHWFLPGWSALGSAPAWARPIAVRETDIDSLVNFELDLAPWYARGTAEYLRALDVDAALWVCPPPGSWSPPRDGRARAFEPFELPYAELRRAIARRAREGGDAFVKYRDSADGADAPLRTWRIARGQRVSGDPILETPWPWAQDALLRFRSFSSQGSPCRH